MPFSEPLSDFYKRGVPHCLEEQLYNLENPMAQEIPTGEGLNFEQVWLMFYDF